MRVRTPCPARAGGDRGQPPMLQIALDELPPSGAQQMLSCKVRPRDGERHSVLQLIAKSVGAAGLIESRSRPDAACKRLIEHPAVENDVQGSVRRFHLDRAENLLPMLDDISVTPHRDRHCGNERATTARLMRCRLHPERRRSPRSGPAPAISMSAERNTDRGRRLFARIKGAASQEQRASRA